MPERVLYVPFPGIGDLILSTYAIRAIRAALPNAEITIPVASWGGTAPDASPLTDLYRAIGDPGTRFVFRDYVREQNLYAARREVIRQRRALLGAADVHERVAELDRQHIALSKKMDEYHWTMIGRALASESFDCTVAMLRTPPADPQPFGEIFYRDCYRLSAERLEHMVDQLQSLAHRAAGRAVQISRSGLDFGASGAEDGLVLLLNHESEDDWERMWTPSGYAAVTRWARARDVPVHLVSGITPDEQRDPYTAAVRDAVLAAGGQCEPERPIAEVASMFRSARAVIGCDSGPLHLADFVRGEREGVIGLYAGTSPAITGPYHRLQDVVSVHDPVVRVGRHTDIRPEAVIERLSRLNAF